MYLNIAKHRKGTVKYFIKDKVCVCTCMHAHIVGGRGGLWRKALSAREKTLGGESKEWRKGKKEKGRKRKSMNQKRCREIKLERRNNKKEEVKESE